MKGQLAVMRKDKETNPNEDFICAHSSCFNELVRKEKVLQENVSYLQTSLDQTRREVDNAKKEADDAREEAYEAKEDADEAREQATQSKKEANKAREDAYEAKEVADEAKEQATKSKKEAEEAREDADKAREDEQKAWQRYDKIAEMVDKMIAYKIQLDQETKQIRQQQTLSAVSRNGNPDKQKDINQAQDCKTYPAKFTKADKGKSKKDKELTAVNI